jgi:hypothetical protein
VTGHARLRGNARVQQWEGQGGHRVTLVTQGVELRRTGKSLHSVLPKAA